MHLSAAQTSTLSLIPDGPPGIAATLKAMGQLVRDYKKSLNVRGLAIMLTGACGPKDYACEVKCLHGYVRDQVRYINDIVNVETVQSPDVTLANGAGDCDDKSTLLCALLESIGHPTRFVAIGFEPGVYSHVLCDTKIGASWISLETTEDVPVGWSPDPKAILARMVYYN